MQTIISVLLNPQGGLKNIPPDSRRICLLNQSDTQKFAPVEKEGIQQLFSGFDSIILASLAPPIEGTDTRSNNGEVIAVHEPVAGIILAAGSADRMGTPKQILPFRGTPLVTKIVATVVGANLSPVIVVTGAYTRLIQEALAGSHISFVHNPDWESGLSSSLKAGLSSAPAKIGSAIFILSDQPFVSPVILEKLVDLHARTLSPIIVPVSDGKRGNPVLFDRVTFHELLQIDGDIGGRAIFNKFPVAELPWDNPGDFFDIDTPDDYQKLL